MDEVFALVKKAPTTEEKVKILQKHDSTALRKILYANFSSRIKFLLPDAPTPFKPQEIPSDLCLTSLYKEERKLYLFVMNGNANIAQPKRESLWIQLLEGLSAGEARILESVKNKNLDKDYGIAIDVVKTAFPYMLKPVDLEHEKTNIKASSDEKPVKVPKKRGRKPKNANQNEPTV